MILDEVQRVPSVLDVVQHAIDSRRAQFVLTGSSARRLRRGAPVNLLPGRIVMLRLDPLSLAEQPGNFLTTGRRRHKRPSRKSPPPRRPPGTAQRYGVRQLPSCRTTADQNAPISRNGATSTARLCTAVLTMTSLLWGSTMIRCPRTPHSKNIRRSLATIHVW